MRRSLLEWPLTPGALSSEVAGSARRVRPARDVIYWRRPLQACKHGQSRQVDQGPRALNKL